jgi:hypothetical protein
MLTNLSLSVNKTFWEELIAYFPWYVTDRIVNGASNNSSIVACVFLAGVKFLPTWGSNPGLTDRLIVGRNVTLTLTLPRSCLATIGEFLPSRWLATIRDTHTDTHRLLGRIYKVRRWGGLRCHDILNFHKVWFKNSEVNRGDTQAHKQHGDRISLFLFPL